MAPVSGAVIGTLNALLRGVDRRRSGVTGLNPSESGRLELRACFNTFTLSVSSDVQNLFHRVQQLEDILSRIDHTPDSASRDVTNPGKSPTPGLPTITSGRERITVSGSSFCSTNLTQTPAKSCDYLAEGYTAKGHRSATQWGPNWYFNGISMSSEAGRRWVSTRTGQAVTWADFSIPIVESSSSLALQPPFSPELCELPDRDATREIISAFYRSRFRLHFPVLDEILFETTMETAYGPTNGPLSSPIQVSAKACVLSALSIATSVNPSRQISRSMDVDLYAAKAHCLLSHIAEDTSLSTLQTALVLQIQRAFHADWQGAAFFQSIACRIVCALRGHLYHSSNPVGLQSSRLERENYHTRMLFWLCYMLDKDISLCTGSPPLLTDVYCDLDLPDNYFDHYTYLPDLDTSFAGVDDETHKYLTPHLPGDPRLSHLKEKVCRQLLSARASKDKNNQLLLNIRQLDDEIEHWRLSIPVNFRPALSVSKNTSPNASDERIPYIIQQMSLQLDYLYLITVIHTTVRKCTIEASDEIPDLHSVVHSSFDLSLMASRSTLWCLRILVSTVGEDSFRFVTFYSSTAALSLFLNIVIHPLDSQSRLDLELLISAANMIRNIPVRALTQGEIARVQDIGSFVMRLVWLGTCAVTKAEKEECA